MFWAVCFILKYTDYFFDMNATHEVVLKTFRFSGNLMGCLKCNATVSYVLYIHIM